MSAVMVAVHYRGHPDATRVYREGDGLLEVDHAAGTVTLPASALCLPGGGPRGGHVQLLAGATVGKSEGLAERLTADQDIDAEWVLGP